MILVGAGELKIPESGEMFKDFPSEDIWIVWGQEHQWKIDYSF